MNICMVVHAYYPHDESRVQREALALQEKGHNVDVICLRKGKEPLQGICDGVKFYRLPAKKRKNVILSRRQRISRFFAPFRTIAEYSKFFLLVKFKLITMFLEKRYKVIQFHNPPDALVFAGLIPKLLGVKIILDIHDLMPEAYAGKFNLPMEHWFIRLIGFIEQKSCSFVDHVLVVTDIWKERLIKRGVKDKKCSVVMNLPDERIFKPKVCIQRSGFNLIYHGTVASRYGVDVAIKAVGIIKDSIPEMKLNIIGEGEDLEEFIKLSYPVKDKVYFSKKSVPVNEIPKIITKMDVGLVPNKLNPFTKDVLNAKLLEYIAMQIPVIVARTPGIEYYFDDSMVVFFEPGNAEELAEKILWLYNNPDEGIKLSMRAKNFLASHNWAEEKEKYCSIISAL